MKICIFIAGLLLLYFQAGAIFFSMGAVSASRAQEVVSVGDYGAIGDGIADDTEAIQNAFYASADIFIPAGTYRISSSIVLPHPFKVVGSGAESTVLQFENMGGYNGSSGIVITQGGSRATGYMSDLTIVIKGANGNSAIKTPRGAIVYEQNPPTYVFERMKLRGGIEVGQGLYDYGWKKYFDIGDGRGHVFRDILIFGNYNIAVDPSSVDTDSAVAFYFSSEQNSGGVLLPVVDHCFTHYTGVSVQFGYRVSTPLVVNSQFHNGYRGIYSPNGVSSTNSNDYGVMDARLRCLNINSQLEGISFAKTARLDVENVRVTRAPAAYDHGSVWNGFRFDQVYYLKVSNVRSYNIGTNYTGTHNGMYLTECDFVNISGYNARRNQYGLVLEDVRRTAVYGSTIPDSTIAPVYFKGASLSDVSISCNAYLTASPYAYGTGVDKSEILLRDMVAAQ